MWLEIGYYVSRFFGEIYGFFKIEEGCVVFEVFFLNKIGNLFNV